MFETPGRYEVTVSKGLSVGTRGAAEGDTWERTTVSVFVDVTPASREALGAVIDARGRMLLGDSRDARMESRKALAMIADPRAKRLLAEHPEAGTEY